MSAMKRKAVFIDRDGVLNRAVVREGRPYPPASVGEVEILPGVPESLRALKAAGFILIVVSNQPDVARGATTKGTVEAINAYLAERLPIDRFIMCYHDSNDGCDCRKPKPGMLLDGAREFDVGLEYQFHGRRPLARHRGGRCRGMQDSIHRLRLRRATPSGIRLPRFFHRRSFQHYP